MLLLVDAFLFVGIAGLVNHGFELVGEFVFVVVVLINEFVHLLEKPLVRRSRDGSEKASKPAFLPRHGGWLGSLFFKDCPPRVF